MRALGNFLLGTIMLLAAPAAFALFYYLVCIYPAKMYW